MNTHKITDNLEKNTRTNTLLTLASRCLGLVRDGAIARLFGAGAFSSAFYFAFLVPNLFRRLFGEGALSAAFLPIYTNLQQESPERAKAFATLTIAKLVVLLGSLTLIGELILWTILASQESPSDSLKLTMVMLPYMPLVCLVAIFGAMLHVHDKFGPTASAPIILNGFMIAAAFGFVGVFDNPMNHMTVIGISIVVAGVVQVAWSIRALREYGWFTKETTSANGDFRQLLRDTLPMVIGLGTLQINTLIDGLVANFSNIFGQTIFGYTYPLGESAMASVSWAQRLYQFPLGVFGIALATAIYPLLAKQAKETDTFAHTMRRGLRTVIFIGLPASAGLLLVRNQLATVVFQGDQFSASDALNVGAILLGYATAVWAYSMTQVLTKGYYAMGNKMTPVRVAMLCVCLNFLLNITLIWTPLGATGLAWSTAVSAVLQVSILLFLFRRYVPRLVDSAVLRSWIKTALLTLVMGGAVGGFIDFLANGGVGYMLALWTLLGALILGVVLLGFGSFLLKMPELKWSIGRSN
jgi:putative peptidoglycan lipid II flippase